MNRTLLFFAGIAMNTILLQAQTYITADTVSGTWTKAASPYIITCNITVPGDTSLVIEAGTEIRFAGRYAMLVDGKLRAKATRDERILFTKADSSEIAQVKELYDTSATCESGWKGIRFSKDRSLIDTSILSYCNITGVKAITGISSECTGGAISLNGQGQVVVEKCRIYNNQAHLGAAIYSYDSNPRIDGNIIERNHSLSNGGAICLYHSEAILQNNLIRYNSSREFGGGLYCENTNGIFVNNTIVENKARFGGAMSLAKSNPHLVNNTIADNQAEVNGGGIHCRQSGPVVENTIVWGNLARNKGKQMYLFEQDSPEITYSAIQGGIDDIERFSDSRSMVKQYEHNLEEDPLFIKEDTAYYALGLSSPCIDAGLNKDNALVRGYDMNGHPRIVNHVIDMGSQEFGMEEEDQEIAGNREEEIFEEDEVSTLIYPNPNNGRFTVEILGVEPDIATLGIVNVSGQVIYTQKMNITASGIKKIMELDIKRGFYFIEVKNSRGEVIKRDKLIIE